MVPHTLEPKPITDFVITGCTSGSSLLNDAFRDHLRKRLRRETHDIEKDGYTLDGILDEQVRDFERKIKRVTDIYDYGRRVDQYIRIQGLKKNDKKRLETNTIVLNRYVIYASEYYFC